MPYLGQRPSKGDENNFKILDDISSYTLTFDGSDATVVSAANDTITSLTHRFVQGQRVTYNKGGGTVITGLSDGVYYIIKEDHNTIKLATSASNASNGVAVNITGVGAGSSHTLNVAFDGVNTKFKATHTTGQKAKITRSAQLVISMNGVIQQPHDTATPSTGFGFDLDGTIVFSQAPVSSDVFWAHVLTNNNVTFDISDNDIDNFTGDGSTVSFNLSKSPPDNRNILVTVDGVVQYPNDPDGTERSYAVVENVLTFSVAPALGTEVQVRHIGFAGSTSGGGSGGVTSFYGRTGAVVLKSTDNIVANNATFSGDLTVNGTTTTLDTKLVEVDKIEVETESTNVAIAVTHNGSGDLVRLYDGASQVVTVTDTGDVGIGDDAPDASYGTNLSIHSTGSNTGARIKLSDGTSGKGNVDGLDLLSINGQGYVYNRENNNLLFGTDNATRIFIKNTGEVGINSTSPREKLDVIGNANIIVDNNKGIKLGYRGENKTAYIGLDANDNANAGTQSWANSAYIGFYSDGSSERSITYRTNVGSHIFQGTNGEEFARINSTGSVGINTTYTGIGTGTTKLAIQSTATSGAATATAIRIGNNMNALTHYPANLEIRTTAVPTYNAIRTDAGDGNGGFTCGVDSYNGFLDLTTGGTKVVNVKLRSIGNSYFNGGNLGIGTESPDAELHVMGQIKVDDSNYARVEYARNDTNLWSVGLRDTDDFWFFRESGSANVIFQHGKVGIGVTNPTGLLHAQNASVTDTKIIIESTGTNSYPALRLKNDARDYDLGIDGSDDSFRIYDVTATAERFVITTDGSVRIDGPTAATHGLRFTPNGWNGYDNRMGYCGSSGADFWWSSNWDPTTGNRDHSGYATNYIRQNINTGYLSFGTGGINVSADERLRITNGGSVGIGSIIYHLGDDDTNFGFPSNNAFLLTVGDATRFYVSDSTAVWNRRDANAGITTQTMLLNWNSSAGTGCAIGFAPSGVNYSIRHSSIEVVNEGNNQMSMRFKVTDPSVNEHARERLRITTGGFAQFKGTGANFEQVETNQYNVGFGTANGKITIKGDLSGGNYFGWRQKSTASGSVTQANAEKKLPTLNDFTYPNSSSGLLIASTSKIGFSASAESPQYATGVQMLFDSAGLAIGGSNAFDCSDSVSSVTTSKIKLLASGRILIGTQSSLSFNGVGQNHNLIVAGSSNDQDITDNYNAAITISNQDNTANNTAGLHFAREDTDGNPHYDGASIVAQFKDSMNTGQYPRADLAFLTSTANNNAPSEKMRLSAGGNVRAILGSFDSRWGDTLDVTIDTASWAADTFYRVVNDNVFDSSNDTYLVWFKWSHDGSGAPWLITGNFLWTPTGANTTGAVSPVITPVQTAHNSASTISFRGEAGGNVRPGLSARADGWNPSGGDLYIKASKIGHPFA